MAGKILFVLFEEKGSWYFKSTNRLSTVKEKYWSQFIRRRWETDEKYYRSYYSNSKTGNTGIGWFKKDM